MTTLAGQKILITGAARGIGAESARRLAARGAQVALVGLEPDEMERVAAQCGGGSFAIEADVTDRDALEKAVEEAAERMGGIDCVMANAGVASAGYVRNTDPDAFERVIEVNLLGVWRTVRAALPHVMRAQGLRAGGRLGRRRAARPRHGALRGGQGRRRGVRRLACAPSCTTTAWTWGWPTCCGSTPTWWRAPTPTRPWPASGPSCRGRSRPPTRCRRSGDAVVDGIENRRRWVTVPQWLRLLIPLRGIAGPAVRRRRAQGRGGDRRAHASATWTSAAPRRPRRWWARAGRPTGRGELKWRGREGAGDGAEAHDRLRPRPLPAGLEEARPLRARLGGHPQPPPRRRRRDVHALHDGHRDPHGDLPARPAGHAGGQRPADHRLPRLLGLRGAVARRGLLGLPARVRDRGAGRAQAARRLDADAHPGQAHRTAFAATWAWASSCTCVPDDARLDAVPRLHRRCT